MINSLPCLCLLYSNPHFVMENPPAQHRSWSLPTTSLLHAVMCTRFQLEHFSHDPDWHNLKLASSSPATQLQQKIIILCKVVTHTKIKRIMYVVHESIEEIWIKFMFHVHVHYTHKLIQLSAVASQSKNYKIDKNRGKNIYIICKHSVMIVHTSMS